MSSEICYIVPAAFSTVSLFVQFIVIKSKKRSMKNSIIIPSIQYLMEIFKDIEKVCHQGKTSKTIIL